MQGVSARPLPLYLLLALALGLANGCATGDDDDASADDDDAGDDDTANSCDGITPEVTEISPSQLVTMLEDKDFQLINVHIPHAGEIPGTDVHIPYTATDDLEEHLGSDLGAKVVLYCLTGPMSAIAADDLVALGYCQVFDLPAAMSGWQAEGHPVDP